jgi:hypothetical protein
MRLDGLCVTSKYLALAVRSRAGSFTNRLYDLIHVFGEHGEERLFTVGYALRGGSGDFRTRAIEFGLHPGVPSACSAGFDPIMEPFTLDAGNGFLGIARGKDRSPLALSPSFPEARAHWLSWVRDVLDAGADGVELRLRNHQSELSWAEYGFEPPVVEEFRRRYGVDLLTTDDFDRALWRRLRGEAYTEFVRQAHDLVHSRGKRLGLHVSTEMDMEPEEGACMDIHWDWRTWVDEGLADSVTMKEVWPRSYFAEQILRHTRQRAVPVIFCPFNNNCLGAHTPARVAGQIGAAKAGGYDGFQFYESAAIVTAGADGTLRMTQPALRDIFRRASGT